jgi:rhombotail lipoprotein
MATVCARRRLLVESARMRRRDFRKTALIASLSLVMGLAGCTLVGDPDRTPQQVAKAQSTPLAEFLYQGRKVPAEDGRAGLLLPIRIGLGFIAPTDDSTGKVPTLEQRQATLDAVRDQLRGLPYVSEVAIVPQYWFGNQPGVGFDKLKSLAEHFDFDLIALVSYDQAIYEFQNMRSLGLVTLIGKDLYKVNVDQALTVIDLALVEPESRALVMRVAAGDRFGDTTTLLDDWRSQSHVRRVSFDRANGEFLAKLRAELPNLKPRVTLPSED